MVVDTVGELVSKNENNKNALDYVKIEVLDDGTYFYSMVDKNEEEKRYSFQDGNLLIKELGRDLGLSKMGKRTDKEYEDMISGELMSPNFFGSGRRNLRLRRR